jgi:predicted house-cleaning noncanonical NTP pyrophosphatase (MazG superfamily)
MSDRTIHNKLVRDCIPDIIDAEGRRCATEIMDDAEYRQALLAKLVEEAREAAEAEPGELAKELADLYEVIDAVMMAFGLDKDAILATQQKRRGERGGFEGRIRLLWVE